MQAGLNREGNDGNEPLSERDMSNTHAIPTQLAMSVDDDSHRCDPAAGLMQSVQPNVAAPAEGIPRNTIQKWFVLQTKSRQEKVVCDFYKERGVEHLLPLVSKTTYYGKRKIKSELPLFPGYVFVRSVVEEAYAADRTRRLVRIIPVFDQVKIEEELRSLTRALEAQHPFDRHPCLVAGVKVEVKSGPLQGVRGVVESRLKTDRLVLQVEILGQAISVEVDTDLLVILEEAPAESRDTRSGIRAA
jgi:transcriptional antiterminator RfaH